MRWPSTSTGVGDANTAHGLSMVHPQSTLLTVYHGMVYSADCTVRNLHLRPCMTETSVNDADLLDHGRGRWDVWR